MIKTIPVQRWHFDLIDPKQCFIGDLDMIDRCIIASKAGFSHTVVLDDEVIAIIGGHLIFKGVMEVWTIISDKIRLVARSFHKKVLELIKLYSKLLKLVRMQMTVRFGYPTNYKWAEALGFKKEALMRSWGPDGDDYYLFARLF